MGLFGAPRTPLPCHRAEGLSASVMIHLLAATTAIGTPTPRVIPETVPALAVVSVGSLPDAAGSPQARDTLEEIGVGRDLATAGQDVESIQLENLRFDITRIRTFAAALFPFLTHDLSFLDAVRERFDRGPDALVNPFGRERRETGQPVLRLESDEVQRLVDRAWSRRERWGNFVEIARLAAAHDPDRGDAATVVRAYVDQNLLQPYFDTAERDPRFWAMLGLAADHAPLIDFIGAFVAEHPSSRTTTELLFMLDELVQGSRDALLMLLSTNPDRDLALTRAQSPDAFALARAIHTRYSGWTRDRGLDRTAVVRAYFDDVRLRILTTILASTPEGYGASDARFLAGRLHWDRGDTAGARTWWRDLGPDGRGSYGAATREIAATLARPSGSTSVTLSRILLAEHRRWLDESAARLASFGHAFDTF